ncbi:unnamed protein product [Spirodela intermedia]|uniref:PORR domain-containing protein n=1 Tax=Spirodela intermedia TaxID=51605 RepID=A0A7I8KG30_SPIIN|nr:unnamed protein product [Spirodela intermedia]
MAATAALLPLPGRTQRKDLPSTAAAAAAISSSVSFVFHFNPSPLLPSLRNEPSGRRRRRGGATVAAASSARKIAKCPSLDRQAEKHHRLRFIRKLTTLLLSKPRHFLPLRILSRHCRRYLTLDGGDRRRSVVSMVLRYPAIFQLFHAPSRSSQSLFLLAVALTPAAAALAAEETHLKEQIAATHAAKLQRLLMLSSHRRLLLSKLAHLAGDLGLPPDFRSGLCNRHPDRFRTVDTSYGRALELAAWDSSLAASLPPSPPAFSGDDPRRPIIDRPPKFKHLKLRRGLNLKRRHREYLIRFQELPEVSPFCSYSELVAASPELAERRACAVVREVLGMTIEKRTLVDHLTHFRKEFGLPNKLRALLVRHPEMFYVSLKGKRDSVFLVEGYDDRGRLLVKDDDLSKVRERLAELVREGKMMRRRRRNSIAYGDGDEDEEEDEESEVKDEEDDDGFQDLFDSGVGDDWEEFAAGEQDSGEEASSWEENMEFWKPYAGDDLGDQRVW